LACGCSSKEHPDFLPDNPQGGRGGTSGEGQTSGTETGGTETGGTENTGNTGTGGSGDPMFDPNQVYWSGAAKAHDVIKFPTATGYASASDPKTAIYGFMDKTDGHFLGNKLLYAAPGEIYEFRADSGKTANPEINDPRIKTPPCDTRVRDWKTTIDERLLYSCKAGEWLENGDVVHESGDFLAVGADGRLLLKDLSWSELGSPESVPTLGVPALGIADIRAYDTGFRVVFGSAVTLRRELWTIEDAVAVRLGVFGDPPEEFELKNEALGGDDLLYRFGVLNDVGVILASSIDGDAAIIHEDNSDEFPIALPTGVGTVVPLLMSP
jgi:hypothetical protein